MYLITDNKNGEGCEIEMESCTVKDQTELAEVTGPVLMLEDGANSNFPITNSGAVIDSENCDKKESDLTPDHSKMTVESESNTEAGVVNVEETIKHRSLEDTEVSKDEVKMTKDVEDAPLTLVDEDDGLMKKLGKLCGVGKQKLVDEEFEPYVRSPYTWKQGNNETYSPVSDDEFGGFDNGLRKVQAKQTKGVGERLAFQGNDDENALNIAKRQFHSVHSVGMAENRCSERVHNDLQTDNRYYNEIQSGREPLYKKKSENRVHEARGGSYPNQTKVQISAPSGRRFVSYSHDSDMYNFTHSQRGYMLVIVNDKFARQTPRDGARWDLRKMREIARKFGFRHLNYNQECNLSKSETLQLLSKASKEDHSDCDCFMFMISTHGLEQKNAMKRGKVDHALVCADEQLIFTSTIMEMFNDTNCPTLKGKPKLFFIQACRGEKLDHGGEVLVAFPRNEDKTCGVSNEGQQGRQMTETVDESDTRPDEDTWSTGLSDFNPVTRSSSPRAGQGQSIYSRSYEVSIQRRQQPSFYVPRIQQSTNAPSELFPQHRSQMHSASGRLGSKIYVPSPYAFDETHSLKCDNDMLVMFAIPPGMFAWRNTSEGSWMIDYLHQVLMAYDMRRPKNFLNLLTKVSALMSRRKTNTPSNPSMHAKTAVSVIEHKLVKDIVFQPKAPVSEWIKKSKTFAL